MGIRNIAATVLGCAILGQLLPAPARADEIEGVKSLSIDVAGEIPEHCAMGNVPDVALGDLEAAARMRRTRVALDCNVPIDIHVSAANGAITNTLYPNGQGPYSGKLGYSIGFVMPIRSPARSVVSHTFRGVDLVGGQTFSSNGGIAIDGMELAIDLAPIARGEGALLGGDYSETIEITIAPS